MTPMNVHKNPIGGTIVIMMMGAAMAGLIGLSIAFLIAAIPIFVSGPLGWITMGPVLLTTFSQAITWVVIGVPIAALVGGYSIANGAMGLEGKVVKERGVTFLDDDHPITIRAAELAKDLGIPPVPYVGFYPSSDINAFAMGLKHENSIIALTDTAVTTLSKAEVDAIIAHELVHVASNDMQRMTLARGIQDALTFFLVFRGLKKVARWIFTPISEIEILRFSRVREYNADKIAAQITSPKAMMSALKSIDKHGNPKPTTYDNVSIQGRVNGLFRTHPPIQARVAALNSQLKGSKPITLENSFLARKASTSLKGSHPVVVIKG